MSKLEKKDDKIKDAMNTMNDGEAAYGLSKWVGAIFYYMINLGKKSFEDIDTKENGLRNVVTGWLLQMMFVGLGIYLVIKIAG